VSCMKDYLTVRIFSVERQLPEIKCDSVQLPIADNLKGEFSGSYGIRKGHAKAVFSLKVGKVFLTQNGKPVFTADISEGFATVDNNDVCITVDRVGESII